MQLTNIRFWIITVTKNVGRDEALFIHENIVFTRKSEAIKIWNDLDQNEWERVELVECSGGKIIESK